MIRCAERAARHAVPGLDGVRVAVRRAVVHDQRPADGRRRERIPGSVRPPRHPERPLGGQRHDLHRQPAGLSRPGRLLPGGGRRGGPADLDRAAAGHRRLWAVSTPPRTAPTCPDWAADGATDPSRTGGSTGSYSPVAGVSASVPASTPRAVFDTERYGATRWAFPVPAGTGHRRGHTTERPLSARRPRYPTPASPGARRAARSSSTARCATAGRTGTFHKRTFDGTTLGPDTVLDPYDDPFWNAIVTGSGSTGQTYRGFPDMFGSDAEPPRGGGQQPRLAGPRTVPALTPGLPWGGGRE